MKKILYPLLFLSVPSIAGTDKADIMHLINYGQSLSIGSVARPIQTTHQRYNNITFNSGVVALAYLPNYDRTGFKPLVEDSITTNGVAIGETPGSAAADTISAMMGDEYKSNGYSYLVTAPSAGGLSISQISKGTAHYSRMIDDIRAAKEVTERQGKTYNVQAVLFSHGEEDNHKRTSAKDYISGVNKLISDVAHDAISITGQSFKPPFIAYQVASHRYYNMDYPEIAIAQYKESLANKDYKIALPMYFLDYSVDHIHLRGWSSWLVGAYYGKAFSKIYNEGADWRPLTIKSAVSHGFYIDVKFDVPVKPLVIDTNIVSETRNFGFSIRNDKNIEFNVIKSVRVISDDSIRIILKDEMPAPAKLTYAFGEETDIKGGGRKDGARGNIRDSDGFIAVSPDGKRHRLYNWLLISDASITQ